MICGNPACGRDFELPAKLSATQLAKRKFCSLKCSAAVNPPPRARAKPASPRFWAKVDSSGGWDTCWPWTGSRDTSGYGLFRVDGYLEKAHRFALKECGVTLPGDTKGLHDCDNPPCCNPNHLYRGTSLDNARDRELRGRGRRPGQPKLGAVHALVR